MEEISQNIILRTLYVIYLCRENGNKKKILNTRKLALGD